MKYFFVIICILFSCTYPVLSQDIKKKYTSHMTEEGSVYFIYPQKGFESKGISSKLEYDITYLSTNDSVTYNFTFVSSEPSPVDSVSFNSGHQKSVFAAEMFFISPHKNRWKHRVSVKVSGNTMRDLYNKEMPYELLLYSEKGNFQFNVNEKKWKEHKGIVNKIFDIIKYNQY